MSKKIWSFLLVTLVLFACYAVVSVIVYLYKERSYTIFSCDTVMVVRKDNAELALAMNYIFRNDNGIVVLKGTLKQGNKITDVSRKNYFAFTHEKGLYHLKSSLTVTSPADNTKTEELANYLPKFYLQEGLQTDFIVHHIDSTGYVFSTGYVPSFYCKRNKV
jgi:hypothetical protein